MPCYPRVSRENAIKKERAMGITRRILLKKRKPFKNDENYLKFYFYYIILKFK